MDKFEFNKAFDLVWHKVQDLNKSIDEQKPWELAKNGETEKLQQVLSGLVEGLLDVAVLLAPFLPDTAEKITTIFTAPEITPPTTPLFPKN